MLKEREPALLKRIAPHYKLPRDPLILDLGSGVGNFVTACRKRGLRAFGIEPDRIGRESSLTSLEIAGKRLNQAAFAAGIGEQLPLASVTFDLVVLNQVLEHVSDQAAVVKEALRVTKPGGVIYLACPNYLRFYESHYKIWFVPLMPKTLASWYLRLRGRDPVLLKQLNYTTNWRLRKLLDQTGTTFVDLNQEDLRSSLRSQKGTSRAGRALRGLIRIPLMGKLIMNAALFYTRVAEGGSEMLAFRQA
jgi:SAM-dependent methyltransferase